METKQHVFDFLAQPVGQIPTGLCVLHGSERFLKTLAMKHLTGADADNSDADFSVTKFDATNSKWSDIYDELSTRSLFGGDGTRIVIVDDADKFVTDNRPRLEKLAAGEGGSGLMVLVVNGWLKTTKLFKLIDKTGLQIDCGPPKKSARSKTADPAKVSNWLIDRAKQVHGFELPKQGAQLLFDLTECEFGRMEQELSKVALFADDKGKVPMPTIKQVVGGWRTRTMWDAVDAALAGDADKSRLPFTRMHLLPMMLLRKQRNRVPPSKLKKLSYESSVKKTL